MKHYDCDYKSMEVSTFAAFIGPGQASILIPMLERRERSGATAFKKEFVSDHDSLSVSNPFRKED